MSDNHDDNDDRRPQHRGLAWYIFFLPGIVILWMQYHFPGRSQVWTSARRKDVPAIQVLYSLGFWALALLFLWWLLSGLFGGR